ncbi:MAG: hypothetical protein ACR2PL_11025 [Dehalococcoidia bacterium]
MGESLGEPRGHVMLNEQESWLVQGLHDGRIWADSAAHHDLREFALNEDRTLPSMAGWLGLEYGRRFADFDRVAYTRAWEAAIGLVWLRRRGGEEQTRKV